MNIDLFETILGQIPRLAKMNNLQPQEAVLIGYIMAEGSIEYEKASQIISDISILRKIEALDDDEFFLLVKQICRGNQEKAWKKVKELQEDNHHKIKKVKGKARQSVAMKRPAVKRQETLRDPEQQPQRRNNIKEEEKMEKFNKLLDDEEEEELSHTHSLQQNNKLYHSQALPNPRDYGRIEEEKVKQKNEDIEREEKEERKVIEREEKKKQFEEFEKEYIRKRKEEEEKLTMIYLQRLQEENHFIFQEQKEIEQKAINELQCSICLSHLPPEQYDPLDKCPHMFHRECIMPYLEVQIESRQIPIKCPESTCQVELTDLDIRDHTTPEIYEKYKNYALDVFIQRNPNKVSCCPTPDCKYVFAADQNDTHFVCPCCQKSYCLDCKSEWHDGMTCEDYRLSKDYNEEDRIFVKFVRGSNFKQCPRCKFWVERSQGCDHMRCRCGEEFCYKCGGKYRVCKCRGYDLY